MPEPGTRRIVDTMDASCSWPWARSPATTCSCVTPVGNWRLMTPSKMRSVASPRIFGPMTANSDADDREHDDDGDARPLGAKAPEQPPRRRRGSPWTWPAAGPCPCPSCRPAGPVGPPVVPAERARAAGVARAAHAGFRLGQLRVDDLAVGLVRGEQLVVRADADDAPGRPRRRSGRRSGSSRRAGRR